MISDAELEAVRRRSLSSLRPRDRRPRHASLSLARAVAVAVGVVSSFFLERYTRSLEAKTRQLVDVIEKQKATIGDLVKRGEKLELQRAQVGLVCCVPHARRPSGGQHGSSRGPPV
jgi:hypothetical protein